MKRKSLKYYLNKFPSIFGWKVRSNWQVVDYKQMGTVSNYIDRLYQRKTDGYLIKRVLEEGEVQELLLALGEISEHKHVPFEKREGFTTPRAFSQIQTDNDFNDELLRSYLNDADWFRDFLLQRLSFDIRNRVFNCFKRLQKDKTVLEPSYKMDGNIRKFTFATFRKIFVNNGGMFIHCGSMFKQIYPNFYERVGSIVNFDRQLSYFIMLQRPEKGGQLRIYDAEWGKYKSTCYDQEQNCGLATVEGKCTPLKNIPFKDIDPMPGDMIVFAGGDIWHEVTAPFLGPERVTFGGFIAYTENNKEISVWS